MNKVTALVGLVAVLLAIVSAFVVIPNLDVVAALVILGIVAGIGYSDDRVQMLLIVTLVYPVVGGALVNVPEVGDKLAAIAMNFGLLAAGAAATVLAVRIFDLLKGSFGTLTGKE